MTPAVKRVIIVAVLCGVVRCCGEDVTGGIRWLIG